MLTLNSARTPNLDAWNTNDWIEHRRKTAYDLTSVQQPVKAKPAMSISSYFPGAEALEDDDLSDIRAQQAQQHQREVEIDKQNQWMLAPVFAPEAVLGGLELGGLLGIRFVGSKIAPGASIGKWAADETGSVGPRVASPAAAPSKPALSNTGGAVRARGRAAFERVNVKPASKLADEGEVHHRIPIQFTDLMPKADPNRTANLIGLREKSHEIVTAEWEAFKRSLGGRRPTLAELLAQASKVDKMIEPYVLRPGLPRPPPKL